MPEIQHLLTGFHVNCDQGSFAFCTVALIRGQNNILVDVGHKGRANLLHDSLVQAGVQLEDINMVVLTHAHWDHCQNIDMFPNARIVIHPNELEYAASPKRADFATARYFLASLQDRDVHQAVEGTELEPGVKILETPGHTRGHISVLVDTPQGPMAISGDALPWATSVITHQPMVVFWDPDEATESIKKLLSASRVFYPGHDRPFRLGPDDSVEYIGGADSIRLMLGQRGIGDVVLKVAPDAPTHLRFIQ